MRTDLRDPLLGRTRPPTMLSTEVQQRTATWAVKQWLLMERAHLTLRKRVIEAPEELQRLRREDRPGDSTRVWLGAVRITDSTFSSLSSTLVRSTQDDQLFGAIGVFTWGAAVFHIYGMFEPPEGKRPQMLDIGPELADLLVPIWPPTIPEVRWPPSSVFTLDELSRRWPIRSVITVPPPSA